jgi:hypothetical protein
MPLPVKILKIVFYLFFVGAVCSAADTTHCYFYKAYPYGTQANYSPLNPIINGAYGIWQVAPPYDGYKKVLDFPYVDSWKYLWDNIGHPIRSVREYGTKEFFLTEVVPASGEITNSQYFPNYGLHSLGAGIHFRETEEWYRYYNVPLPRIMSVFTMAAYHLLEEMIEFGGWPHLSVDPIADLYIFDPLGIILFSSDHVARFFSESVNAAEWSLQPSFNLRTGRLENTGQFYSAKLPVPLLRNDRWKIFGLAGLHDMAGVSHRIDNERWVTAAGGLMVENIVRVPKEGEGLKQTAEWKWSSGIFFDRNNSLLASLYVSGVPHNRVRLNVYPGFFKIGPFEPGILAAYTGEFLFGFNLRYCPVGLSGSLGEYSHH